MYRLTLTVPEELVQDMQRLVVGKKRSLSELVEAHFKEILERGELPPVPKRQRRRPIAADVQRTTS